MRLTRPKPSHPSTFSLGEWTLAWIMWGTRSFPVCLEKWKVNRLSTWERKRASSLKLRTVKCASSEQNPLQTCVWNLFFLFFWVFSIKALENCRAFEVHCVSPPDPLCLVALYVQSGEIVCQLWCSGLPLFVCLPSHQFPLCNWSSLQNHRIYNKPLLLSKKPVVQLFLPPNKY